MIPTIETIVEDLLAGTITKQQAIAWLHQHAEGAANDLRDAFAIAALPQWFGQGSPESRARDAYRDAEAMLKQREVRSEGI